MTSLGLGTRSASRLLAQKQQPMPPSPESPASHNSTYSEALPDELAHPADESDDPMALLGGDYVAPDYAHDGNDDDAEPSEEVDADDGMEDDDASPEPDADSEEESEEDENLEDAFDEDDGEAEAVRQEMAALLETVPDLQDQYRLVDRLGEGRMHCYRSHGPSLPWVDA